MPDITIRGAGIFGLSIAWAAVQRSARVRIIDPAGTASGASGGVLGALAPHVPENWNEKKAFQLESLLMAESFWAEVEAAGGGSSGYARNGRLQPVADAAAHDLAAMRAANAAGLWQGRAEWRLRSAADFGPWCPETPTGLVVEDTLSAQIHPRRACAALVAALGARGVAVLAEGADSGQVVHAAGWRDLDRISRQLGTAYGNGVKGQAALLRHDAGRGRAQIFAGGLHIVAHGDGTVAVGSTSERDWSDPSMTDGQLDALIARAREALPVLGDAPVVGRWAGIRPRARSRAPVLGLHPLHKGQFIANGGFKIGFGMAPKVAQVMADLVLEGIDTIPEGFRASALLLPRSG